MTEPRITISNNGSLKVEGDVALIDADGNPMETREGKPFYLCRCGASNNKPFCDGRHNTVGFDGSLADQG